MIVRQLMRSEGLSNAARASCHSLAVSVNCGFRPVCYLTFPMSATRLDQPHIHPALAELTDEIDALRETGAMFWQRGWSVGTSSNYSVVLSREPLELLITASGKDKGRLTRGDFVRVGASGKPTAEGQPKSSAETLLHVVAAQQPGVGAVLHTHSVWSTLLSDFFFPQGGFEVAGYEMLKGLEGITTHEHDGLGRDFREHAKHSRAGRAGPRADERRGRAAAVRLPDPPARPLYLGPRPGRSPAARRDF